MSRCTICHSSRFQSIASIDHGVWKADSAKILHRDRHIYPISTCKGCGHVMINHDYSKDDFNRMYMDSPQGPVFWPEDYIGSIAPYRDMAEMAGGTTLSSQTTIADFGCGPGELLQTLHSDYGVPLVNLFGMDFNNRIALSGINYHQTDLNDLPDAMNSFGGRLIDTGFASHVFEHLIDPSQFLCDLKPHMAKAGAFFIEVPDFGSQSLETAGKASLVNAQHIHYFSTSSLRALIINSGWSVTDIRQVKTGYIPRLQALVSPASSTAHTIKTDGTAAEGVLTNIVGMKAYRQRVIETINTQLSAGQHPALWGVGAEMDRMLLEHPVMETWIKCEQVQLYDQAWQGHSIFGAPIHSSNDLVHYKGPIIITPMIGDVLYKMKKVANSMGINVLIL